MLSVAMALGLPVGVDAQGSGHANCVDGVGCGGTSTVPTARKKPKPAGGGSSGDALMDAGKRLHEEAERRRQGESRREREAIERQLQQLRKTGADNGCPESIEVGGQRHSVADPIREQGGAAQALAAARKTLREIQGGGRCADSSDPTACHMLHELWSRLVNALECHADAPPVSEKPANAVSAPAAAVAGGHALMDMVDDPGDGGTGAGSAGQPASATPISKPKPPASGSRQAHLSRAAFPTPRCQFVTDGDERHDAKRWVCVAGEVYECRDRSSTDPSNAWSRVSTGGCGEVRAIERIEQERFEQRRQADNIYEPE